MRKGLSYTLAMVEVLAQKPRKRVVAGILRSGLQL
jgi:hypothetical protein